jgi:hypothetical protein
MVIELVHVGFDNFLAINRVVAIAAVNSEPIRRVMQEARNQGLLVDMTHGRKTKAVIVLDSKHIILAALAPETIAGRLQSSQGGLARPEQSDEQGEP